MEEKKHTVITIGREFGAGGRELGKMLAESLGLEYYDKQLLAEAARRAGVHTAFFESNDERVPDMGGQSIGFSMGYGQIPWYSGHLMAADTVMTSIADVIEHLATTRGCVIVGRSADYILRQRGIDSLNIFLHAPLPNRVERIIARSERPITPREAAALARKTDRLRADYYNFYTDGRWGDSRTYHLTFDTSRLPLPAICSLIQSSLT